MPSHKQPFQFGYFQIDVASYLSAGDNALVFQLVECLLAAAVQLGGFSQGDSALLVHVSLLVVGLGFVVFFAVLGECQVSQRILVQFAIAPKNTDAVVRLGVEPAATH